MSGEITELTARQALSAMESGPFAVLLRNLATGREVLRAVVKSEELLPKLCRQEQDAYKRIEAAEHERDDRVAAAVATAVEAERVGKERADRAVDEAAQLERLRDDTRRELAELREELAPLRAEREAFRKMAATL